MNIKTELHRYLGARHAKQSFADTRTSVNRRSTLIFLIKEYSLKYKNVERRLSLRLSLLFIQHYFNPIPFNRQALDKMAMNTMQKSKGCSVFRIRLVDLVE